MRFKKLNFTVINLHLILLDINDLLTVVGDLTPEAVEEVGTIKNVYRSSKFRY